MSLKNARILTLCAIISLAAWLLAGCATAPTKMEVPPTQAQGPVQPKGEVSPGLAVIYYKQKIRHLNDMASDKVFKRRGKAGEPLMVLDHKFVGEPVFGSGQVHLVGMLITGFIKLDAPGLYEFQADSNDGIRLFIGGQLILEDPDVHGARLSPIGGVQATAAGWYPLRIRYFQRKGSATLKLTWKRPGDPGFSVVPASAYGHVAGK